MDSLSRGSSHFSAEFDAFGQVIVNEGEGRYSLRSKGGSARGVSKSLYGLERTSSLSGSDPPRQKNGPAAGLFHGYPRADHLGLPETSQPNNSQSYRRRSESVDDVATTVVSGGGTISTEASSVLRRISRWNQRRRDSESSDSTTRNSDRKRAKRGGDRHKKRRQKKGRSIDKHKDSLTGRRNSAPDAYPSGAYDAGSGPDNNYWRGMVAQQRRQSSVDSSAPRGSRHGSPSSSRRRGSENNKFSVRPPQVNGTSPPPSVGRDSVSQFGGSDSKYQMLRRQSSSNQKENRGRCRDCPTFMFIVVGCLLVIIGVLRIFITFWHEFGSSVWAGALVSILG